MMLVNCGTKGCRTQFTLTDADLAYFKGRGWKLPRHCAPHRAARRPLRGGLYHISGGEYQRFADPILLYNKHS